MEKDIKIIFEDKDVMVIDKPANLVVSREGRGISYTLEDYLNEIRKNELPRNGIAHRLDKGTSGLILAAKNMDSLQKIKKQFKDRVVKKKYFALICGDLPREGEINMPIARSRYGFGKFGVDVDGKAAVTSFKLVSKYKRNGKIYSLIDIDLKTGRTHQIRVHFSYLRWPLVGDKLYGGETPDDFCRPFLHSHYVRFFHPSTDREISFESDLAPDLKNQLKEYEKI